MSRSLTAPFAAPRRGAIPQSVFDNCEQFVWSPKLNGHRAHLSLLTGKLTTRKQRDISSVLPGDFAVPVAFLQQGIRALEGELVLCDENGIVQGDLGKLTSAVSQLRPNVQLQLWIFDCDSDQPFLERINVIARTLRKAPANAFLHCVPQFTPFVSELGFIREYISPQIEQMNFATEGIVIRQALADYNQPNMYKMTFLRPKTQLRAMIIKVKSDNRRALVALQPFEDDQPTEEKEFGFSKRAFEELKGLYASPLMSSDPNKQMTGIEVVVDMTKNCIVGLSTNWL